MAEEPKFTVIIPTLRRQEPLRDTLASIAACDPLPEELIIVDAGASDATTIDVTQLDAAGVSVQVIPSPKGVSRQRNLGIARANGELIVFLDDDVLVAPGLFATARTIFLDPTIVAATGHIDEPKSRRVISQSSKIRRFFPGGGQEGDFTPYGYPNYLRDPTRPLDVKFMQGCLMCVRAEAAAAVGFDERLALAEDEDFAFRLSQRGRVRYDPRLSVIHRKLGFRTRDRRAFDRSLLISRLYIFRKNFPQRPLARLQFGALAASLLIHRVVNLDLQGALGVLDGMRWAFTHDRRTNDLPSPPSPSAEREEPRMSSS